MMSAGALRVIVVEDDADLCEEVADYLTERGMTVRQASSGAVLDRMLAEAPADVIVLDLGLPGEDGIGIARRLRARGSTISIVMMTARTRVEERILGYETGANLYMVKPVDYSELDAAIRALCRLRPDNAAVEQESGQPPAKDAGRDMAWRLDLVAWRLAAPSGASVRLTRAETQALACLAEEPGQPVSRDDIAIRMGKVPDLGEHRYVDQIVSRLRRKIATELGWEAPIGSAHGQGYFFVGSIERTDG